MRRSTPSLSRPRSRPSRPIRGTTPVSSVDVTFNEPINTSSLTAGAVTLTDNGSPVDVSGVSLTLVQGTTSTYAIGDLSGLTAASGSYTLSINAADIEDQNGFAGAGPAVSTSWVVAANAPTITWANPADIIFGTSLSATQLDATANTPGTFTYTPAAGTVLGAGNDQTLSVSFTPTDTMDYTSATATVTINVLQATPTITWANPADIVYGTPLSATQLDATANVAGYLHLHAGRGHVLDAGSGQTLSVSFVPDRLDRLHRCDCHGDDQRPAGHADDHLGQSGRYRLRHATESDPARRHGQRARNLRLHAGRGHRPGRWHRPDAFGQLRTDRHDRLHHRHRHRHHQCPAGDPDDHLGQPRRHTSWHGTGLDPVGRHRLLYSRWEHGQRARYIHLHAARGHGPERGQ